MPRFDLPRLALRAAALALVLAQGSHAAGAPVPAPAPLAPAQARPISDGGAPPHPLDEAAALARVAALPEVRAVGEQLRRAHVKLAVHRDDDGSAPFQFAVAEDHTDHEVTRYRFAVDPASGAVTAYEVECDLWSPLARWRALQAKLAALSEDARSRVDTCAELAK